MEASLSVEALKQHRRAIFSAAHPLVGHRIAIFLLLCATLNSSGCYFFRTRRPVSEENEAAVGRGVIGESLGAKAGSINREALRAVHAVTTAYAPAGTRPDPDTFVRRLLLEYRDEGATVAAEIARVEQYRLLLGGASEDFSTPPQDSYDATSLLAELKVAEEVCGSLVAPSRERNGDWQSILPSAPNDTVTNLRFLAQRILGVASDRITEETLTSLKGILDGAKVQGSYTHQSYVPVCATLVIDAEALLL